MQSVFLIFIFISNIVSASEIYEKISDLFNLTSCTDSNSVSSKSPCQLKNSSLHNSSDLKSISENQFYNDLSISEIERLNCSKSKAQSLQKTENLSALKDKIAEFTPLLKKLRRDKMDLIIKNQILNGKIPKSVPPKPGTIEYQRKAEYDDRNEEIKSLMALEEMMISQIPFSESAPIRDLIDDAISANGIITESAIAEKLKKVDSALDHSVSKIQDTQKTKPNFDLSTDQKISLGTDDFLISKMISKNPENISEIKKLQCSSQKIKNGQMIVSAAGTAASFLIPVGLASAGRIAFLMRAPMLAQKFTQISRVAGYSSMMIGNAMGAEHVFKTCTKNGEAKVISGSVNSTNQCDYSSQTLTSDFNLSSCIMNATLMILPNAGAFLTKKIADRNSFLSKYISDIQDLPSLKKMSKDDKEIFLRSASAMTDAERKAATAILAERAITQVEKDALMQAHALSPDKGYFQFTPEELKAKLKILQGAGFSADESDMILRSGLAGQIARSGKTTQTVSQVVEGLSDSANKSRLLAELKSNSVKPDVAASTDLFKKSTNQYLKEIQAQGSAPSARQYSEIEYVSARWASQSKDPQEIAAATKAYTDAVEKRFRLEKMQGNGENVQAYIQMLQSDPGRGLHADASRWKVDAIKKYYNSKGWNLR